MKYLLTAALLVSTCNAYAHEDNDCNVDLDGGLKINEQVIEFSQDKTALYRIEHDQYLYIDDQSIALTDKQQALVNEYSSAIKASVPQAKGIAISAIDLAIDGVNLAFTELLGENNDVSIELTEKLAVIREEISTKFSTEQGFYIDEDGFADDGVFGDDFEQRIESAVEDAVQNSIGSLMIALGQEMLFSGGDSDAFETKMAAFGEKIETDMEARGELIEKQGLALCQSIVKLDQLEEQLKAEFTELNEVNIISVSHDAKHSI